MCKHQNWRAGIIAYYDKATINGETEKGSI